MSKHSTIPDKLPPSLVDGMVSHMQSVIDKNISHQREKIQAAFSDALGWFGIPSHERPTDALKVFDDDYWYYDIPGTALRCIYKISSGYMHVFHTCPNGCTSWWCHSRGFGCPLGYHTFNRAKWIKFLSKDPNRYGRCYVAMADRIKKHFDYWLPFYVWVLCLVLLHVVGVIK